MNAFESYIMQEYRESNVACTSFKYSHSIKEKIDKTSKRPIINNIINVKIDCYDDKHNLLSSHTEKFVDGQIQRSKQKQLVNIAPSELNNRFAAAKQQIANRIMSEYMDKLNEIQDKINILQSYVNTTGIIPNEFVNEPAIGAVSDDLYKEVKNKQFEF